MLNYKNSKLLANIKLTLILTLTIIFMATNFFAEVPIAHGQAEAEAHTNSQVNMPVKTTTTLYAHSEPFFIQYQNEETLAENKMLSFKGKSYFPLADILKMLNGEIYQTEAGYEISLAPSAVRHVPSFTQTTVALPKQHINTAAPSFQETVNAYAAAIIENTPENIMFAKNGNKKLYPASTTKIITALIALEHGDLTEKVIVSQEARNIPHDSSRANIQPGDELTLEQLLYAMMIPSGNDAAVAVAAHIAGSEKNFIKLMNQKAHELGATSTNFVNPHGYHDPNQFTTALDLAKIAHAAAQHDEFLQLVSTPTYTATYKSSNGKTVTRNWQATNQQIRKDTPYYAANIIGGKTGYTSASRHTLVSFAEKNNNQYVTVILRGDRTARYDDTNRMLKRAIETRHAYNQKHKSKLDIVYTDKTLFINEKKLVFTEQIFTHNGRIYIPLEGVEQLSKDLEAVAALQQNFKVALDQVMVPFINEQLYFTNGRLYLPLRSVFEFYNFSVIFDNETGTITSSNDKTKFLMQVDSKKAEVNGVKINIADAPFVLNSVTYVPIRFFGEHVASLFDWGIGKTLVLK